MLSVTPIRKTSRYVEKKRLYSYTLQIKVSFLYLFLCINRFFIIIKNHKITKKRLQSHTYIMVTNSKQIYEKTKRQYTKVRAVLYWKNYGRFYPLIFLFFMFSRIYMHIYYLIRSLFIAQSL